MGAQYLPRHVADCGCIEIKTEIVKGYLTNVMNYHILSLHFITFRGQNMATIQVRLDDNIKAEADSLFESLGLDTSKLNKAEQRL